MDISNKTLAAFLLAAIVISLAGTIISLNKIGDLSTTGFGTASGNVSLSIEEALSITTEDSDSISFGNCNVNTSADQLISSDEIGGGSHGLCSGYTATQYIALRNDGNIRVAVNVSPSDVGEDNPGSGGFLPSESETSTLAYKFTNDGHLSNEGGCDAGLGPTTYTLFGEPEEAVPVCDNLGFAGVENSVLMDLQINLPRDVELGTYSVVFTFSAESI